MDSAESATPWVPTDAGPTSDATERTVVKELVRDTLVDASSTEEVVDVTDVREDDRDEGAVDVRNDDRSGDVRRGRSVRFTLDAGALEAAPRPSPSAC